MESPKAKCVHCGAEFSLSLWYYLPVRGVGIHPIVCGACGTENYQSKAVIVRSVVLTLTSVISAGLVIGFALDSHEDQLVALLIAVPVLLYVVARIGARNPGLAENPITIPVVRRSPWFKVLIYGVLPASVVTLMIVLLVWLGAR